MKKPIHIYCHTYQRNIYSFFAWTQDDFEKYMKKNYDTTFNNLAGFNGITDCIKSSQTIVLWVRKDTLIKNICTLTHEAIHVANFVFDHAGVKLCTINDETQAYYVSMIVRHTLEGAKCLK